MKTNDENKVSDLETKKIDPKLDNEAEKIKKLEMALKDSANKFKEAESIAHFGFWELDPTTLVPTWTDGLYNIVGYDPASGELKQYADQKKMIHPDDWDYFYNATQTVINTGKDVEFGIRVIRQDSSARFFHVIAKPKNDENGKVIGVKGTAQDITELKTIENHLKESEAFYKTLFEHTGTASILIDDDTTILMANTQFEKLSGYSKEDLEAKMSWKEMVLKEDLEMFEKYHYMRRNGIKIPPESYEARLMDKEGNIKIILINVTMIPGTKRSIASLTDLTEIKIIEEALQTTLKRFYSILSNMRASILLVTEENIVEFANQAFCDYFRLTESPEDLPGLTASEMIKKIKNVYQFPNDEITHIRKIVSQWEPVIGEEVYLKGKKTCIRDFIPIFVKGKPYGRLWLHLDITERKKMEKKLFDSERHYKYIVEKSSAGMFLLDKKGIIQYLNEQMAHSLNYSKNQMLGRHIKNFVVEKDEFYNPKNQSENQIIRFDGFKFLNRYGEKSWTILTVSPIFNSKNEYTGLLGIVTDIALQKGLEEAFLEREEILTDIIYDMMEILNNMIIDGNKAEFNKKDISNTFKKIMKNS
ncbi:MAG: PAS domain S-box [Methanobacterium sp. Maddingley MBC34]|nr:MAG: PAS domain S-box [Methanobacterium sp. Maddingley MBC34]